MASERDPATTFQLAEWTGRLLDVCQDCIKLISPAGDLIYMNRAGRQALGIAEDSSFGMAWLSLLPEEVRQSAGEALAAARQGTPSHFTGYSQLPGRSLQVWDNSLTAVTGPDGGTTAILCTSRDITAERSAQDALRQSQERLVVASRVGGLGIWDYDIASDVLFCDETWYRIMGRDPNPPIRCIADFRPLIHPEDVDRATEVVETAAGLIAQNRDYAITFRIVRPDGDIRWVRSAACLVQDLSGKPIRAIGFVVDITDTLRGEMALRDANRLLEEERDSLAQQCMEDPLTRIANRRYLDSELLRICRRAVAGHESIAVAMIDIDHFKAYNDHYGHLEGDGVLRRIATTLKAGARPTDFVARYGGEEFAFILHPAGRTDEVFERLVAAIEALAIPHPRSAHGKITISCGCVVQRGELEPSMLLKAADEALYRAKAAGGNCRIIVQRRLAGHAQAPEAAR